ncbi:methyl-accepting chemotaxis protein [Serratia rhizosphaerae]|uniref:methyl-accepting chemotaxis protein n=1 Tax=Serratia rhizosphaerae TaxID=2597702 RepID=UPI002DB584DD|nr:nitrate- and nitrite sensing domain-containing protein [Serratia rhizosphaerae]MEB6335783.1 nitrate- and nitrite sensing domain-containing protein [Serratia rhizosphaerae]
MSWMNHISMKMKLFVALLPMLLALCWFVGSGMVTRMETQLQMDNLGQLIALAGSVGGVIDELQKERGMSAGVLASGGKNFTAELAAQRKQTDSAVAVFRRALAGDRQAAGDNARRLAAFNDRMQALDAVRSRVSGLNINAADAVAVYTVAISDQLRFVGGLSQLSSSGKLVSELAAYYSLLNLKEQAGQERALLAGVFAADRFGNGQYRALSAVVAQQAAWLTAAQRLSSPALAAALEKSQQASAAQAALRLRDTAFARAERGGFGIDPTQWFSAQTARIDALHQLENGAVSALQNTVSQLSAQARGDWQRFLLIGTLALAAALSIAVAVARRLHRHLEGTLGTIQRMESDFTLRLAVPGSDELSRLNAAYNQAIGNIQRIIQQINVGAGELRTTSGDIAVGNQNLAQRTDEQAASIVETAASMEQIATAIAHTASNAGEAERLIGAMTQEVQEASRIADDASQSMVAIRASSEQIAHIVSSIDDISFQTNLLALNAAVEAARAGESGRGFAVVAAEVRNLSQRCTQEANRIRALVGQNMEQIGEGVARVADSNSALQAAVGNTGQMRQYVSDIAHAAQEQTLGVSQIQQALNQLEQVTQQNAALVSEVAAASQVLDEQAETMAALVHSVGK